MRRHHRVPLLTVATSPGHVRGTDTIDGSTHHSVVLVVSIPCIGDAITDGSTVGGSRSKSMVTVDRCARVSMLTLKLTLTQNLSLTLNLTPTLSLTLTLTLNLILTLILILIQILILKQRIKS